MLTLIAACGTVPAHWLPLLIVLALKPGRPANTLLSYRPITLAELLSKGLERVLKPYYDSALLSQPLHPAIMAYRPGFSTGIALFVALESCLHASLDGRKVVLVCGDVKYSYNGADRSKIEVLEWDLLHIQGQRWELSRQLAGNTTYQTRYHGILTQKSAQAGGLSQGKVLSGTKSNIGMHPLMTGLDDKRVGVIVNGRLITGPLWSDDLGSPNYIDGLSDKLTAIAACFSKEESQMELSKLYLVPAFHHARRWAESGNSDSDTPDVTPCEEKKKSLPKYCKWEVKNSSHRMGQAPVTVKHSGLLLGKRTGPHRNDTHTRPRTLQTKPDAP